MIFEKKHWFLCFEWITCKGSTKLIPVSPQSKIKVLLLAGLFLLESIRRTCSIELETIKKENEVALILLVLFYPQEITVGNLSLSAAGDNRFFKSVIFFLFPFKALSR
ncbi:MAG: hypothetical protein ACI8ZM_004566 [Crocinitomix sp.]|jgi:hypothetical protein